MEQAQSTPEGQALSWSDPPYYLLDLAVGRCRRYHAKMASFYWGFHNTVLACNAILGTSAFVSLLGGKATLFAQIATGILAALTAIDTVFRIQARASRHEKLLQRFTQLAAEIADKDLTDLLYRKLKAKRLTIEIDEPGVKRLVDLAAQNEEMRSRGYPADEMIPLSWLQRRLGYVFTFDMERLERTNDARKARSA